MANEHILSHSLRQENESARQNQKSRQTQMKRQVQRCAPDTRHAQQEKRRNRWKEYGQISQHDEKPGYILKK